MLLQISKPVLEAAINMSLQMTAQLSAKTGNVAFKVILLQKVFTSFFFEIYRFSFLFFTDYQHLQHSAKIVSVRLNH